MTSQKQKIIRGLALEIEKILDSILKKITETQDIIQEMKDHDALKDDFGNIETVENMLKKEIQYLKKIAEEKDSLVLLTTTDEDRYEDTKQTLEKMFQDIKTHVIEFYEEFYPQFETLYSILHKSPRGPVGKNALSSSKNSSTTGFYIIMVALTLLLI
jgi:gas vesicle protein